MRMRASSPRLVSWVAVVREAAGPVARAGGRSARGRRRGRVAEPRGVAADLVERGELDLAVERRVLQPLGLDRPGRLLEPDDEHLAAAPGLVGEVARRDVRAGATSRRKSKTEASIVGSRRLARATACSM